MNEETTSILEPDPSLMTLPSLTESSKILVGIPYTEYDRDRELRGWWHRILDNKELLEKLPSEYWQGLKLQEILWSGKIKEEEGWEENLVKLWKKS